MPMFNIIKKNAILIFVIIIAITGFFFYNKLKKSKESKQYQEKSKELEKQVSPDRASFLLESSEEIYDALKGVGTDEGLIFNKFNDVKNQEEYELLKSYYGVRKLNGKEMNLSMALRSELSKKELENLRLLLLQNNIKL